MFIVSISIYLAVNIVVFLLEITISPISTSYSIYSLVAIFIKLIAFAIGVTSPVWMLHMIEATPRAMRHLQPTELIIKLVYRWIAQATRIVVRARLWLTGKRPFLSGTYSLANMFAVTAVPYRLYPLSCTLLE